jgi:hypothetical protein
MSNLINANGSLAQNVSLDIKCGDVNAQSITTNSFNTNSITTNTLQTNTLQTTGLATLNSMNVGAGSNITTISQNAAWAPTPTVTNCAWFYGSGNYLRINNIVQYSISGTINVVPAVASFTVQFPLPFTGNFTTANQVTGCVTVGNVVIETSTIANILSTSVIGTNRVSVFVEGLELATRQFAFNLTGSYAIL